MRRGRRAAAEAGDRNKWEEEVVAGGTGGGGGGVMRLQFSRQGRTDCTSPDLERREEARGPALAMAAVRAGLSLAI